MGLDNSSIKLLCAAKAMGASFQRTLTIGRQAMRADHSVLQQVFDALGIRHDAQSFLEQREYADDFFSLLGAGSVDSMDVSAYEQATILHDMNLAIPPALSERFTLVHDGGALEHVFNVPQAFKNCMEMVSVGGYFTQVNNANNFSGHGFWQFSPELIFRLFSPENGFRLEAVLMHEVTWDAQWYAVSDPDDVRRRIELCNSQPTYILTIAKRVEAKPVLEKFPQQSDYVSMWNRPSSESPTPRTRQRQGPDPKTWTHYIPRPIKKALKAAVRRIDEKRNTHQGFRGVGYRPITVEALLRGKVSLD